MNTLAQLKQSRAALVDKQKDMVAARAESENKVFSEAQKTEWEDLQRQIETLDGQIQEEQQVEDFKRSQAQNAANAQKRNEKKEGGEEAEKAKIYQRFSITKALRSSGNLDGAEKEVNEIGVEEYRASGFEVDANAIITVPMRALRTQSVTGDSGEKGGELVVNQTPQVQLPFEAKTFLEQLGANRLSGLTGGSIPLPVAEKHNMQWLAENAAITPESKKYTGPELSPERVGGAVDISNRLIVQSSANVQALVSQMIIQAYERVLNTAAINGSGAANEPTGILNTTGVVESTQTAAAAPEWARMTELPGLIDNEDATDISRAFLMDPILRSALMSISKDSGSGRFLMESKDELAGYTALATSLVPVLSGNRVLIHGDFSKLFIGEWGGISILEDNYSASLNNAKRLVLNAHAGVQIAQPNAFAVNKFLTV